MNIIYLQEYYNLAESNEIETKAGLQPYWFLLDAHYKGIPHFCK
jgi:hypothetical protein